MPRPMYLILAVLPWLLGACDDSSTFPSTRDAVPPFSVSLSWEQEETAIWIFDDTGRSCVGYTIEGSAGVRAPGVISIRLGEKVTPPDGACLSAITPAIFRASFNIPEGRRNLVITYRGEFDVYDIEVTPDALRLIGDAGNFSFPTDDEFPRD